MNIDWDCAAKAFGGAALYGIFIAAIVTGGFVGNPIVSIALFFTFGFGALGFCLYKSCISAKKQEGNR